MNNKAKAIADLKTLHTVIVKACGNLPLTIDELVYASKYAADLYNMIRTVDMQ